MSRWTPATAFPLLLCLATASRQAVAQSAPETPAAHVPDQQQIEGAIKAAYAAAKGVKSGKNADYIPYLAQVPSGLFAIAVVTVDGTKGAVGDGSYQFSIQSIAKPFTLARLLEEKGPAAVADKIGVGATGLPFNSITAMEMNKEHPAGNPLVNAGAIATVSQIGGDSPEARWNIISANLNAFAGKVLPVNDEVYKSETATNTRNRAIVSLLKSAEVLGSAPEQTLDLYTRECSVSVNTDELAVMGATLANGGVNPLTGKRVVSADSAERTLAVMATAGLYENTGQWMFDVGAPAKSGVGGGIVAVVPGRFAVAAFSPPLDKAGNSVRAQKAIASVIEKLGGNLFAPRRPAAGVGGSGAGGGGGER